MGAVSSSRPRTAAWLAERALPFLLAATVACALVLPRMLPVLMAINAVTWLGIAWSLRDARLWELPSWRPGDPLVSLLGALGRTHAAAAALLVWAGYAALSASWSPVPGPALMKVSWLVMVILTVLLASLLIPALPASAVDRAVTAVVVAAVLASLYLVHEIWRGQSIARFIQNTVPGLHPGASKHVTLDNGAVAAIGPWVMNRNMGAMTLLLWPAVLCTLAAFSKPDQRLVRIGLVALLVVAAFGAAMKSWHESSQIALVVSAVVLLIGRLHPPAARAVVLAGWIAAVLAMLPVALLAHKAGLHENQSIQDTGQARIILWNFTANKYLERPLLGVGANATKSIDNEQKLSAKPATGQVYAERTGQHGHNVFLQTWFELGLIGALLLLAGGVLVWRTIATLPALAQPFALAAATSAMCIGALTWGLWQEWYLSLFALTALLTILGARGMRDGTVGQGTKPLSGF